YGSPSAAIHAIVSEVGFLSSGFPYRGEDWGVWSLVVFLNQRHLAFSIAVFLLVLALLISRHREAGSTGESTITNHATAAGVIKPEARMSAHPAIADLSSEPLVENPGTSNLPPGDSSANRKQATAGPAATSVPFVARAREFITSSPEFIFCG